MSRLKQYPVKSHYRQGSPYCDIYFFVGSHIFTRKCNLTLVFAQYATDKRPITEIPLAFVFGGWGFGVGEPNLYWGCGR